MVVFAFGGELNGFSPFAGSSLENQITVSIIGVLIEIIEKQSAGQQRDDEQQFFHDFDGIDKVNLTLYVAPRYRKKLKKL